MNWSKHQTVIKHDDRDDVPLKINVSRLAESTHRFNRKPMRTKALINHGKGLRPRAKWLVHDSVVRDWLYIVAKECVRRRAMAVRQPAPNLKHRLVLLQYVERRQTLKQLPQVVWQVPRGVRGIDLVRRDTEISTRKREDNENQI